MNLVLTQDRENIRILKLNRPEVRNALNLELRQALDSALDDALTDKNIRALVLTGEGKVFCSGLDLADLASIADKSTEENRQDSEQFSLLLNKLYTFPKPIIAALNGHAIAGGAGLASVCDLVVMSDSAKFGYTEARIGFVAALVSVFLVRQVGERQARDLLLSARLITAQEALEMKLVSEIRAPDNVLNRAVELASEIAKNAPSSLAMTKTLLASVQSMGLEEGLRYATELNALARTTDDLKEGVGSFLEKREPSWKS